MLMCPNCLLVHQASLDEPTHSIVMHHAKPNKLQSQALLLAEKVRIRIGLEVLDVTPSLVGCM